MNVLLYQRWLFACNAHCYCL